MPTEIFDRPDDFVPLTREQELRAEQANRERLGRFFEERLRELEQAEALDESGARSAINRAYAPVLRGVTGLGSTVGTLASIPFDIAEEVTGLPLSEYPGTGHITGAANWLQDVAKRTREAYPAVGATSPREYLEGGRASGEWIEPALASGLEIAAEQLPQVGAGLAARSALPVLARLFPKTAAKLGPKLAPIFGRTRAGQAATLSAGAQESAGIIEELEDQGVGALKRTLIGLPVGFGAGSLERIGGAPLLEDLAGPSIRRTLGELGREPLYEALTEMGQEGAAVGARYLAGHPVPLPEALERIGTAGVTGAVAAPGTRALMTPGITAREFLGGGKIEVDEEAMRPREVPLGARSAPADVGPRPARPEPAPETRERREPVVVRAYHGASEELQGDALNGAGRREISMLGTGFYASPDIDIARVHGPNVAEVDVRLENPATANAGQLAMYQARKDRLDREPDGPQGFTQADSDAARASLIKDGYDGVYSPTDRLFGSELVAFFPERQIRVVRNMAPGEMPEAEGSEPGPAPAPEGPAAPREEPPWVQPARAAGAKEVTTREELDEVGRQYGIPNAMPATEPDPNTIRMATNPVEVFGPNPWLAWVDDETGDIKAYAAPETVERNRRGRVAEDYDSLLERDFPFIARFGDETVAVMGPVESFAPYARPGAKPSGRQMMVRREDGTRAVMLSDQLSEMGRPLIRRTPSRAEEEGLPEGTSAADIDPNTPYGIVDHQTGEVVYRTTWKNRARARRWGEKKDIEYGAYRYKPMVLPRVPSEGAVAVTPAATPAPPSAPKIGDTVSQPGPAGTITGTVVEHGGLTMVHDEAGNMAVLGPEARVLPEPVQPAPLPEGAAASKKNWPVVPKAPPTPSEIENLTPGELADLPWLMSTRNPTAVSADPTENPLDGAKTISTGEILRDPATAKTAANIYRSYGILPGVTEATPDADVFERVERMATEVGRWLYGKMDASFRDIVRRWYDGARTITERWSRNYGLPRPTVAGVIAVLSPQADWFRNLSLARRVIEHYLRLSNLNPVASPAMLEYGAKVPAIEKAMTVDGVNPIAGRRFNDLDSHEKAVFIRLFDQTYFDSNYDTYSPNGVVYKRGKRKIQWQTFPIVAKAVDVIEANADFKTISTILGKEHKVRNFFNNILFPNLARGDVTIDSHAVAGFLFIPLASGSREVSHNFGGKVSKARTKQANYRKPIAAGMRTHGLSWAVSLPDIFTFDRPATYANDSQLYRWEILEPIIQNGLRTGDADSRLHAGDTIPTEHGARLSGRETTPMRGGSQVKNVVRLSTEDIQAARRWIELLDAGPGFQDSVPGVGSSMLGISGVYGVLASGARKLGDQLNLPTRALQSILWEGIRSVFPDKYKDAYARVHARQQWEKYGQGQATLEGTLQSIWDRALPGRERVPVPAWVVPAARTSLEAGKAGDEGDLPDGGRLPGTYGRGRVSWSGIGGRFAADVPRRARPARGVGRGRPGGARPTPEGAAAPTPETIGPENDARREQEAARRVQSRALVQDAQTFVSGRSRASVEGMGHSRRTEAVVKQEYDYAIAFARRRGLAKPADWVETTADAASAAANAAGMGWGPSQGFEHIVWLDPAQPDRIFKAAGKNWPSVTAGKLTRQYGVVFGPYKSSPGSYLDRVVLANELGGDIRLEAVTEPDARTGMGWIVTSQPLVSVPSFVDESRIDDWLRQRGFLQLGKEGKYSPALDVQIKDTHEFNFGEAPNGDLILFDGVFATPDATERDEINSRLATDPRWQAAARVDPVPEGVAAAAGTNVRNVAVGDTVTQQMADGTVVTGTVEGRRVAGPGGKTVGTNYVVVDANGNEHSLRQNAQVQKSRAARRAGQQADVAEEARIAAEESAKAQAEAQTSAKAEAQRQRQQPGAEPAPGPVTAAESAASPESRLNLDQARTRAGRMGVRIVVSDTTPAGNPMPSLGIATMDENGNVTITIHPDALADPDTLDAVLDEEIRHAALLAYVRDLLNTEGFTGNYWEETVRRLREIFSGLAPEWQERINKAMSDIYGATTPMDHALAVLEFLRMASQLRAGRTMTESVLRPNALEPVVEFFRGFQKWLIEIFGSRAELPPSVRELFERTEDLLAFVSQEQNYADENAAVWERREPLLRIRRLATTLQRDLLDSRLFRGLRDELEGIADEAAVNVLAATGVRDRFNPEAENFPDEIEDYRPLSAEELARWERFRAEIAARNTAERMRERERLAEIRQNALDEVSRRATAEMRGSGSVDSQSPTAPVVPAWVSDFDLGFVEDRLRELDRRIAKRPESERERAIEINERINSAPQVRAAARVLDHPTLRRWLEVIDRIERGGFEPTASDQTPFDPNIAGPRRVATNRFAHDFDAFAEDVAATRDRNQARILESIGRVRSQIAAEGTTMAEAMKGIRDVMDALRGRLGGTGGTLGSREAAEALAENETAILRLAEELARTDDPTASVAEYRDSIASGITPAGHVLRDLATRVSLSPDALARILELTRDSNPLRSGILEIFDTAFRHNNRAAINTIAGIEDLYTRPTPAPTRAGSRAQAATNRRQARALGRRFITRARADIHRGRVAQRGLREELVGQLEAEQEQEYLDELADPDTGIRPPDPTDTRQMVFRSEHAEVLDNFKRVHDEGEAPVEQPAVRLVPGQPYDQRLLARLREWLTHAEIASEANSSNLAGRVNPNDAATRRGLDVALPIVRNIIEENFTPEELAKSTLGPNAGTRIFTSGWVALKEMLPRLLPGNWGRRLSVAGLNYVEATRRTDALFARRKDEWMRAKRAAFTALDLNPNSLADQEVLAELQNEVSHRLRQFGSGVRAGDLFIVNEAFRGRPMPAALVDLVRLERNIFREAQDIERQLAYGGIRETHRGRRYVRAPAETGDVGLGRQVQRARVRRLSEAYEAVASQANNHLLPEIEAFWDQNPDAVLSHILDSQRTDVGGLRTPELASATRLLASDIRAGRIPVPATVADYVAALAARMQGTANAPVVARESLLRELAWYGARARQLLKIAPTFGSTSEQPITGSGIYSGESDITEFTSPAAKLNFPGSFYTYGATGPGGLRGAVERVADSPQVEYYNALRLGIDHLSLNAERIRDAVAKNTLDAPQNADLRAEMQWVLGRPATRRNALGAEKLFRRHAGSLTAGLRTIGAPQASGFWSKLATLPIPYWLTSFSPAITNVASGISAAYNLFTSLYGPAMGSVMTTAVLGTTAAGGTIGFLNNLARRTLPKNLVDRIQTMGARERTAFLDAMGLGYSYDDREIGDMGEFLKSPAERIIFAPGQALTRRLSPYIGVRSGDTVLNRSIMQFALPVIGRELRRYAQRLAAYPGRWGSRPEHGDPRAIAAIREILGGAQYVPEEFLRALTLPRTDPDSIDWLHMHRGQGGPFVRYVIDNINAANRLNRPASNPLMSLLGWLTNFTAKSLDTTRDIPARPRARRWLRGTAAIAGAAVPLMAGNLLSRVAKNAYKGAWDSLAEGAKDALGDAQSVIALNQELAELAKEMAEPPPGDDDDDEEDQDKNIGWSWQIAARMAELAEDRIVPMLRAGRKMETPFDPSFSKKSTHEKVSEMLGYATEPWSGLLEPESGIRTPALSWMQSMLQTAWHAGTGVAKAAGRAVSGPPEGRPDPGFSEAASSLGKAGSVLTRNFGPYGAALWQATSVDRGEHALAPKYVQEAARKAGVKLVPPPKFIIEGFAPPAVERPLLAAGIRASSGDPDTNRQGVSEVQRIASVIWNRAHDQATKSAKTPVEAVSQANAAVARVVNELDPVERGLGRTVTRDELTAIEAQLDAIPGARQRIEAERLGARTVAKILRANPPENMRFRYPGPSSFSPVRSRFRQLPEAGVGGREDPPKRPAPPSRRKAIRIGAD